MQVKEIIKKKKSNKVLSYDEINYIINGFTKDKISYENMTDFIASIYKYGMTRDEAYALTDAMIKSGNTIDLSSIDMATVDKHSTGGIGDKTSIILLPVCASLGVCVPKMSGRSLGITGGTVDKLESIPGYKVNLTLKKFLDVVSSVGCADISQSEAIAPADKKIYKLRDETGYIDSIPLIASSIMSKKIACGSQNIVIDLKVGSGAFMKNKRTATRLAKLMIYIGGKYNKKVICVLTSMDAPLGSNIGNILEVKEAMNFFDGKKDKKLEELIIELGGYMTSLSKNISLKNAKKEVKMVINNGVAKSKFYEWIEAQGGDLASMNIEARKINVKSNVSGYVSAVNAEKLGTLALNLGAGRMSKDEPINPNVGIVLKKKIGDYVERDEILATIYYNKEVDGMVSELKNSYEFKDYKVKEKNIILKVIK